jgi:hypothetical protein
MDIRKTYRPSHKKALERGNKNGKYDNNRESMFNM